MDVLKPELLWIDGRCYRKNPTGYSLRSAQDEEEDISAAVELHEEVEDIDESLVERMAEGKYRTTVTVPNEFHKYVIGSKGATKKMLESETRTSITVPRQGQHGDIVIIGHSKHGVASARTRIEVMLDAVRQKQPFTHFISFPFNQSIMKNAFLEFKSDVLRDCDGDRGLEPSLFQNPDKLHVTVGTLVLMDDHERKLAADTLEQCREEILWPLFEGKPIELRVEGIEYMNDDPAEVDVLYAKVTTLDGDNRLQQLADRLVDKFVSSGLMHRQYDKVKLHITLMNTLFRTDKAGVFEQQSGKRNRETFDARNVLQRFEKHHFADLRLAAVHLSQLHSTGPDGYYSPSAKLELPT